MPLKGVARSTRGWVGRSWERGTLLEAKTVLHTRAIFLRMLIYFTRVLSLGKFSRLKRSFYYKSILKRWNARVLCLLGQLFTTPWRRLAQRSGLISTHSICQSVAHSEHVNRFRRRRVSSTVSNHWSSLAPSSIYGSRLTSMAAVWHLLKGWVAVPSSPIFRPPISWVIIIHYYKYPSQPWGRFSYGVFFRNHQLGCFISETISDRVLFESPTQLTRFARSWSYSMGRCSSCLFKKSVLGEVFTPDIELLAVNQFVHIGSNQVHFLECAMYIKSYNSFLSFQIPSLIKCNV